MKISIDTKEDSHEDILKVIRMLRHLVGEESYSNQRNIFDNDSPSLPSGSDSDSSSEGTSAFGAMFGDDGNIVSPETDEDSSKEDKTDDDVEIVPY
ncbi:MAG: hypothetical protein KAU20_07150 [Nanoarchaeota archaeon]|nr:hypothetical protein [Nanoarchaeota archaeon]